MYVLRYYLEVVGTHNSRAYWISISSCHLSSTADSLLRSVKVLVTDYRVNIKCVARLYIEVIENLRCMIR
jgi:hypothetical protein